MIPPGPGRPLRAYALARFITREATSMSAVRDDGCGFDVDDRVPGRGPTNINDRLVAVGGSLVVESRAPGAGVRTAGTIPLSPAT